MLEIAQALRKIMQADPAPVHQWADGLVDQYHIANEARGLHEALEAGLVLLNSPPLHCVQWAKLWRELPFDTEPKSSKDHVSIRRVSQEAETRRLRHQINLEVLVTLRRALPRDVTDHILKSSMCKIHVKKCPDKLYAEDPESNKLSKPIHKHCQRQRRAIPPPKHRGR